MAATATSHEDVKVVLIDTQYVETDPLSFKSVVQRLTGKDCCVAWIEESSFSGIKTETKVAGKVAAERSCSTATVGVGNGGVGGTETKVAGKVAAERSCSTATVGLGNGGVDGTETKVAGKVAAERSCGTVTGGAGNGGVGGLGVSMLTKGFSFRDLDRMILEAPPVDELKWLWAD